MQYGLLAAQSNAEMDASAAQAEDLRARAEAPPPDPNSHLLTEISGYIERIFQSCVDGRGEYDQRLIECALRRNGKYSASKLAQIEEVGGIPIYVKLTSSKASAAESWLMDICLPRGETVFSLDPADDPEMPQALQQMFQAMLQAQLSQGIQMGLYPTAAAAYDRQRLLFDQVKQRIKEEAETRCARMESKIHDYFEKGGYYKALRDTIKMLCTFPLAILKGPEFTYKDKLSYVNDGGNWQVKTERVVMPTWETVHPRNFYWMPGASDLTKVPTIEIVPLTRSGLYAMKGVEGYSPEMIDAALSEYELGFTVPRSGQEVWKTIEGVNSAATAPEREIEGKLFFGSVPARWLLKWGVRREFTDLNEEFEVRALKVGRFVVQCTILEPGEERPYAYACFDKIPGQVIGRSLSEKMEDSQDSANAAVRALAANMGFASGPMAEVEVDRLAEGENFTQVRPWRVIQVNSNKTTPGAAIRWFQPESNAQELTQIVEFWERRADEETGIPRYASGINEGTASTASGQAMLLNQATREIKDIVVGIDDDITVVNVKRMHRSIMLSPGFEDIKCDVSPKGKGSTSLMMKEQLQVRRQEFLDRTMNPVDMQIIGVEGRAELLRHTASSLEIPVDRVIPTREQMIERGLGMGAMATAGAAAGQAQVAAQSAALDPAGNKTGGADLAPRVTPQKVGVNAQAQ